MTAPFRLFDRAITTRRGAILALRSIQRHITDAEVVRWPELAASWRGTEAELLTYFNARGWLIPADRNQEPTHGKAQHQAA